MSDVQAELISAMLASGVIPKNPNDPNIRLDGKLHRFRVEHDKGTERTGWVVGHSDGVPNAKFGDWRHDEAGVKWVSKPDPDNDMPTVKIDPHQKKKKDAERADSQREASETARQLWERAQSADPSHGYLQRKNINPYGLRQANAALLVPYRDVQTNAITTVQRIFCNGDKGFFEGATTKGACYTVGADIKVGVVLVCEGAGTAHSLHEMTGLTVVACGSCHAVKSLSVPLAAKYQGRRVIVCADNDLHGKGVEAAKEAVKSAGLAGYIVPQFKEGEAGSDYNDLAQARGIDEAGNFLKRQIDEVLSAEPSILKSARERTHSINGNDLLQMTIPPIRWAIEGLLPSGLAILAGNPKQGKSLLAMNLALAVVLGGRVLSSLDVERGSVLALCLEDVPRRLQSRILDMGVAKGDDLSGLTLITEIPRQHEGGTEIISSWCEKHSDRRLVIVDTLAKFRRPASGKGSLYDEDYSTLASLKSIADRYNVPMLIIHHLRKMKDAGDYLSEISGTMGITGAADTLLVLKRTRGAGDAVLHMTGRDVEEREFAMRLEGVNWVLLGDAQEHFLSQQKKEILAHLKMSGAQKPTAIGKTLGITTNTAQKVLSRMYKEGLVYNTLGAYSVV